MIDQNEFIDDNSHYLTKNSAFENETNMRQNAKHII